MPETMVAFGQLVWGTLALRPYVFIFLSVYLWLATWHWGLGRTLLYLVAGYGVAWLSEFSSIYTGFPYGRYIYIPATRAQELWIGGVPFMDSLSYVFLSYASYSLALLILAGPRRGEGKAAYSVEVSGTPHPAPLPSRGEGTRGERPIGNSSHLARASQATIILAAVMFVTLDIIIDPLALRGYCWFLGQIYGYPEPAFYFGIPLSNFAGWLIVGLIMMTLLQRLESWSPPGSWVSWGQRRFAGAAYLGAGLYMGILLFNLGMTFYIGETLLGLVGLFIYLLVATLAEGLLDKFGILSGAKLAMRTKSRKMLNQVREVCGSGSQGKDVGLWPD
jgi:putative membrane protein